jgi:hypothetical protein
MSETQVESKIKTITFEELLKQGETLYGKDKKLWRFKCPMCNTVQSFYDFVEAGVEKKQIENYLGFSCIGRYNGNGKSALFGKPTKKTGCDWSLGGLFTLHKKVIIKDGKEYPRFEFADED